MKAPEATGKSSVELDLADISEDLRSPNALLAILNVSQYLVYRAEIRKSNGHEVQRRRKDGGFRSIHWIDARIVRGCPQKRDEVPGNDTCLTVRYVFVH